VLASPPLASGESPLFLSREQATDILDLMCGTYQVVLVDTPGVPTEAARAALAAADRIFLVTELTVPSLRGCLRTVDALREEGVDTNAVVEVVVNKYGNRAAELSPAEASRTLNLPLRVLLPRDDTAAWTSANTGMPLAEVRGGATLHRAIAGLVSRTPDNEDPSRKRTGLLRLFSGAERRA
jgi:pilus assembly protein CpaE